MKTKITLVVIIVIAAVLLLSHFNKRTEKTYLPNEVVATSTLQTSSWEGEYRFEEMAADLNGLQNVWSYKLNVYTEGGVLKAVLSIDGYQTIININALVNVVDGKAKIVLDSYGKDNRFTPYKKGDVLFTLTPAEITEDPTDLGINWGKMQPNLEENKMRSAFVKVTY